MTRSYNHKGSKDKLAHYFCTLHCMAPIVRYSLKARSRLVRAVLRKFLRGYDVLFRLVFV